MKVYALLICVSFAVYSHGQKKNLIVKFCPLTMVDFFSFPTIQAGIEFPISQKISWYNEIGVQYIFNYDNWVDTNIVHDRGFKFKTEIRYNFRSSRKKSTPNGYYAAVNAFFTRQDYNWEVGWADNADYWSSTHFDCYGIHRNVFGSNFVMGYQKAVGKKLFVDVYAGFGIRYINYATVGRSFDYNQIMPPQDLIPAIRFDQESKGGTTILPNFTTGLRICYKF